ncbi:YbfB/YjiJ family MFS transporter [Parapusillimonas granuli]|uniref:YbfB/YjiJ family MFS transporter n=1 Tax=Parapusillimonas granuli TaxID=380911 RepID=A0A853FWG9_9BURK|nr:YbfB/YjiJ family MFS transporter [Parapusillimonas granuli]MBB5213993.1 putative MFS family arabinose efflux permease [Parapusillimonas granuli]NYT50414.1 YbfB/YjiJ family MFS transporter [Parapusillimonas granuli]
MRHYRLNDGQVIQIEVSHCKNIYSKLFNLRENYSGSECGMDRFHTPALHILGIALSGLAALAVAIGIGRFAFTPQLPLMQADLGLSLSDGGWLAGANYLGYFAGAVLAGRKGMPAAMLMRCGLWAVVASTAAMAVSGPFAWWIAMRFVAGVASAGVLVGTATVILARLAMLGARRLDGLVFAGVGTGIALAGLVCHAGVLLGMGARALWLALAGLALVGTFIAHKVDVRSEAFRSGISMPAASAGQTSRGMHLLVLCYGLFGFGYILPATYLPSQARLLLDDPALFGWVWPLFGIAAALSTLSIAFLARWPRTYVWAGAQAVMAVGVSMPVIAPGLCGLAVAALCVGGTFMLITLLGLQEARQQAGPSAQRLLAAMTAAFAAGQLAGPIAANFLLEIGWPFSSALWLGSAALLASSASLIHFTYQKSFTRENP